MIGAQKRGLIHPNKSEISAKSRQADPLNFTPAIFLRHLLVKLASSSGRVWHKNHDGRDGKASHRLQRRDWSIPKGQVGMTATMNFLLENLLHMPLVDS